jgi:hypothetical protein
VIAEAATTANTLTRKGVPERIKGAGMAFWEIVREVMAAASFSIGMKQTLFELSQKILYRPRRYARSSREIRES